ncbi:hypothetical protein [Sphingobium yanoikuyae]|jgi:hypothetical protein|uniref:hypothetical protein n=1 Tax=Sphingobium yanoikuyae TaxID=13690 RepID=UPI00084711D0
MRLAVLLLLTLLLACSDAKAEQILRVQLSAGKPEAQSCTARISDQSFDISDPALETTLKPFAERHMNVHLIGVTDVPYRCVGSLIYLMQRIGFPKIGFISEAPPADENAESRH